MDKLYISRKEAMHALMCEANTHSNPVKRAYTRAAAIIEQITAEDVQPIRHGRWIELPEGWACSFCGNFRGKANSLNFCSFCGAYNAR